MPNLGVLAMQILEPCQSSLEYQPPNLWTMGILGLLAEIYNLLNLKMNLQFDIEVSWRTQSDSTNVNYGSILTLSLQNLFDYIVIGEGENATLCRMTSKCLPEIFEAYSHCRTSSIRLGVALFVYCLYIYM